MITRQIPRVVASTYGESTRVIIEAERPYRYRFDAYLKARDDGMSIPAAANATGISLKTALTYERVTPAGTEPEPVALPPLGPTGAAILALVATEDGLTSADIAVLLERPAKSLQRSIANLAAKGCIEVAGHRAARGTPAAVWAATTTGRAALEQHQQGGGS